MKTVDFARLPLDAGDIVLDLGCGEGRHVISAYVEANVHSIGVDLSLDDLKITRERFASFAEPGNEDKSFSLSSASALRLPFSTWLSPLRVLSGYNSPTAEPLYRQAPTDQPGKRFLSNHWMEWI